ncbi:arginine--tRNA ligase [Massilia sp. W12]|uniref:arginine--tRNA ligase n=1 Tax=Massilia sp. W12 TaxID=3126507 RepID=UPI0030CA9FE9
MLAEQKNRITALIAEALAPHLAGSDLQPTILLEVPRDPGMGDLACNIAMQLAKALKKNPRELGQAIASHLQAHCSADGLLAGVEVAGLGFINLRLSSKAKQEVVKLALAQGADFGKSRAGEGKKVIVEFVSANPTGPLHIGHGRQGALGDSLCALLETQSWQVTREFYYNDAGVQIANLTRSVQARARGLAPGHADWPADAYNGDYIAEIAADFMAKKTVSASDGQPVTGSADIEDVENIRAFAVTYLRHEQDMDLQAFNVKFDNYYLESSLYTDGKVDATVAALEHSGKTYEKDGALWLATSEYGDDKDRVMRKSDGTYTYFLPDVAYHINKWERGFVKAINVQGSDHHGTVARVRAGLQAVNQGIAQGYPDYVLHRMVTVMKGGEEVKLSKRAGSYVTLRDLIEWCGNGDEVRGRDAVRFFLISRKADTEFVFDIDLALKQNDENPVLYVQYAHARICSVLEKWGGDINTLHSADLSLLSSSHELQLMALLAQYPDMLQKALAELGPHQVAFYLRDLAGLYHSYYFAEKVLIDDTALRDARLALYLAVRQVLQNGLRILGVSAPNRM